MICMNVQFTKKVSDKTNKNTDHKLLNNFSME